LCLLCFFVAKDSLSERVSRGEPAAVARAISKIEDGAKDAAALMKEIYQRSRGALVIGITGSPGAGKSSLVDKLARGEINFGGAADDRQAYFGTRSNGISALDLRTGERTWVAKIAPFTPPRQVGQTAALTVIPGVVFSGGADGVLRAFAASDGKQVWEYDTLRDFTTVNGVAAKGGAMGAPGPTMAGGMIFVGSGYTGLGNGRGGNVLLAFGLE